MKKAVWTRCDELNKPYYLEETDLCLYHHEYYQGRYDCSDGNQKVSNLKIEVSKKGTTRWNYKICAIQEFASLLIRTKFPVGSIFTAASTSKRRESNQFDSRLDDVIQIFTRERPEYMTFPSFNALHDTNPVHYGNNESRRPDILKRNISFLPFPKNVSPDWVFIVDDVITTGGHFIAMRDLIKDVYPEVNVCGLFFAKRIFSPPPNTNRDF